MLQRLCADHRGWLFGLLLLGPLAAGCENTIQAERDALWTQNQELEAELATARQALEAAEADRARLSQDLTTLRDQNAQLEQQAGSNPFGDIDGVEVIPGAGQITVRVPGDVLFDPGKITLKSSAKKTLNEVATVLKREYGGKTIRVEGYTDTDPIRKSNWKDNLQLSSERAMAVERYLASQGVPDELVYSAAFGQAKPRASKAQSRRVEIVVVMR